MKKSMMMLALLAFGAMSTTGCVYHGSQVNLKEVADAAQLINVTTGDGTFEHYTATSYHTATEFGIAVGIPYMFKIIELYPSQKTEDLMKHMAKDAAANGANAMIQAHSRETYYGFPFGIVGIYVDRAEGTGIATK